MRLFFWMAEMVIMMVIAKTMATSGRKNILNFFLRETEISTNYVSALTDILTCLNESTNQVTMYRFGHRWHSWRLEKAAHDVRVPQLLSTKKFFSTSRGSVHVVVLIGVRFGPHIVERIRLLPFTNPNGVFIIIYEHVMDFRDTRQIREITKNFKYIMGTNRVIHLFTMKIPFLAFVVYEAQLETLEYQYYNIPEFCATQIPMRTTILTHIGRNLKGISFKAASLSDELWVDIGKTKRIRTFEGEMEELLLRFGMFRTERITAEARLHCKLGSTSVPLASNIPKREISDVLDFSVAVAKMHTYLVVRRSQRIPLALLLLQSFEATAWGVVSLTVVLLVLVWMLVTTRSFHISDVLAAIFDIVEIIFTGASLRTTYWSSRRILALSGIVLYLIVSGLFRGMLQSFLTVPKYSEEIDTIKDALDATQRLYITRQYYNRANNIKNVLIKVINNRTERDESLRDIFESGEAAAMVTEDTYSLLSRSRMCNVEGRALLHKVREPLFSPMYMGYPVSKNHATLHFLNILILRVWQSGLNEFWTRMQLHGFDLAEGKNMTRAGGNVFLQELKMTQQRFSFTLFCAGMGLATIIFLLELTQRRLLTVLRLTLRCLLYRGARSNKIKQLLDFVKRIKDKYSKANHLN